VKLKELTSVQRRLFKREELASYKVMFIEELRIFKLTDHNGYVSYKNSNATKNTSWLPKGSTEKVVCGDVLEVTTPEDKKWYYNPRNLELIEGGLRNVTSVEKANEYTIKVTQQFTISQ